MSQCSAKAACAAPSFQCYVQPPRAPICRPPDGLRIPAEALEACTIYQNSFCPPGPAKRAPLRQHDNLQPANCRMEAETVHKLSFPGLPCVPRACPVLPCNRNIIGEGPLSCVTTQRHDFVPKAMRRVASIVPPTHLRCSEQPLECTTVMNASYVPLCAAPQRSYKPITVYCPPAQPLQAETVQKLSYVPWPLKRKEHYPWACKGAYMCPSMPMESSTIMGTSYQGNACVPRRPLILPPKHDVITSEKAMEVCTIYKKSFCPPGCAKRDPLRAHDNLKPACAKMEGTTVHKLSFPCLPNVKPACPVLPCNRNIIGEGPLSCVTTQRHDFVPKAMRRVASIVPPTHLRCSEQPLECATVASESYAAPPPCAVTPQRSYKPIAVYCRPAQPLQAETVQKLSYVPWPLKRKEHYPWACKGAYMCPTQPLEATSIYRASFPAPGTFLHGPARCPAESPKDCAAPRAGACKADCFDGCCY